MSQVYDNSRNRSLLKYIFKSVYGTIGLVFGCICSDEYYNALLKLRNSRRETISYFKNQCDKHNDENIIEIYKLEIQRWTELSKVTDMDLQTLENRHAWWYRYKPQDFITEVSSQDNL